MGGPASRLLLIAGVLAVTTAAQNATAVIRSGPPVSPEDVAALEAHVLQHPDDLNAERELLQIYSVAPRRSDPASQALRLQRILYLVQHHPEAALSGSSLAYVYRAGNRWANANDHEALRGEWLGAAQSHPRDDAVTLNSVWFLAREDAEDAEQVLVSALEDQPANRKLAANLGFFYAAELLAQERLSRERAMAALKESANPIVLAAAGTALPNLSRGHNVDAINQTMFDLASDLSARARRLAPEDPDLQGPMPFIGYFAAAEEAARPATSIGPPSAPAPPSRVRIAENVQATNLIRKTVPQYPERAREAGITGDVRMNIVIGRDGTVQTVQLISGHPLLVEAARECVESWRYKPALLNGNPIEVVTTVTVSFPPASN